MGGGRRWDLFGLFLGPVSLFAKMGQLKENFVIIAKK
jgi:hypothetical protein